MSKEERIARVEHQREEMRLMMFEVEEKNALAMINNFAVRMRDSNQIVRVQRKERDKMYDGLVQAIKDEVGD